MDISIFIKDYFNALKDCGVDLQDAKNDLVKIIESVIKDLENKNV